MKCSRCDKEARGNGLCGTHYRQERVKQREDVLKSMIGMIDGLKGRHPTLAKELDLITKDAKPLFREYKERKGTPMKRIDNLEAEIAQLKAALLKK